MHTVRDDHLSLEKKITVLSPKKEYFTHSQHPFPTVTSLSRQGSQDCEGFIHPLRR